MRQTRRFSRRPRTGPEGSRKAPVRAGGVPEDSPVRAVPRMLGVPQVLVCREPARGGEEAGRGRDSRGEQAEANSGGHRPGSIGIANSGEVVSRMEPGGLEPPTFCMPCRRAPNCAMAPCPKLWAQAGPDATVRLQSRPRATCPPARHARRGRSRLEANRRVALPRRRRGSGPVRTPSTPGAIRLHGVKCHKNGTFCSRG